MKNCHLQMDRSLLAFFQELSSKNWWQTIALQDINVHQKPYLFERFADDLLVYVSSGLQEKDWCVPIRQQFKKKYQLSWFSEDMPAATLQILVYTKINKILTLSWFYLV